MVLDQVEREFIGSSMEALKAKRVSDSEVEEVRMKREKEKRRERNVDLCMEVAIGGDTREKSLVF